MSEFTYDLLYFCSEFSKIIFHIGVLYFLKAFLNQKREMNK